jgi:SAM-dependent methyltransferase
MVEADVEYVQKMVDAGLIQSPCLELGAGYGGMTCRQLLDRQGIRYIGTDMLPADGVDVVADFELPEDALKAAFADVAPFSSVLVLNVLEHTFDPIRILDNALCLLKSGGTLVVLTPTVWPLHNYPFDCWRINPDFYVQYARRRNLTLQRETFEYVGFGNVASCTGSEGEFRLPPPSRSRIRTVASRVVHKAFNTFGRGMMFPAHVATAAVMCKPA